MNPKKNNTSEAEVEKGKVKVGQLQRNFETPTDLTVSEQRQIKGGRRASAVSDQINPTKNQIKDQ